ncbi:D-alanyl-D-alanine carboxypeptidase [Halomonas sp. MCCC 1A17488]|uniref:D-alanyl-D-alanine carboxypeptidase n=1 Tax=Billgrantia sulfidoxydans TaxID=2733484 RepID=A0ABX7VYV7_9GAMM|nr:MULTISPECIES: D-alanyl-D-alanine carboxypeptidase [Halomonas]MCE8016954.1 D-alanyl-D-alanine carboxypeptidase [Halomonas sp. MCCC 1A17488]MCG3240287.1 D-alanyl-D-alanine carboxypeptidase [Halomonas sp. MCCC 1A17488]QPP49840.1 D-alanyl-D-alanine carboxypeptidase [Halomonas sp. SS10-MC5]QTP53461.1 D-alanyl-D-alanine carboxypeptidase [Halomonas sulfidoxydans]
MRSYNRHYLGVAIFFLLCLQLLTVSTAQANPRYAAIVIDVESGDVLHADNADATRYPASLTKMMTLYMLFEALENGSMHLSQPLPVSSHAASMPASKLWLSAGSTIAVEDAIKALVVRSANDVAVVVAEALGGTESGFARMMTQRANELGMPNTVFRNASGLPDNAQVTTARDMATLSIRVMQDFPQYYHYFSTQSFSYRGTTHTSHNRLVRNYPGADGLKTGFIRASGFNVATSAIRNDRRIVSVVMGGFTAASRDTHMADLLDRGFARLSMLQRGDWIARADVLGDRMELSESPPASAQQLAAAPEAGGQVASAELERRLSFQSEMEIEMGSADDPIRALIAQADSPRAASGNWAVQVGAFNDADQARNLATRAADQLASLLNDVRVSVAESGGDRRVFRARLVDLQESDAHSACDSLRAQGMDCMVVAHN